MATATTANIVFGTTWMQTTISGAHVTLADGIIAKAPTRFELIKARSEAILKEHDDKIAACWEDLFSRLPPRNVKPGRVVKKGKLMVFKEYTDEQVAQFEKRKEKREKEAADFLNGPDSIVTHKTIDEAKKIEGFTLRSPFYKRSTKQQPKAAKVKRVQLSSSDINALVNFTVKAVKRNEGQLEVVRKRRTIIQPSKVDGISCMRVILRHMNGNKCSYDVETSDILDMVVHSRRAQINTPNFMAIQGTSGLISAKLRNQFTFESAQPILISGSLGGIVRDARERLSLHNRRRMTYFSVANKYWDGFNRKFLEEKPRSVPHACTSNLDVTRCGEVAAICLQALYPCGRITCKQCIEEYTATPDNELMGQLTPRICRKAEILHQQYPDFPHAEKALMAYTHLAPKSNPNAAGFEEIFKMVGSTQTAPFTHVNKLNEILLKGGQASAAEFYEATNQLKELARFLRNRSEVHQRGDLTLFRNKVSAKAHFNADLMCDNQLDNNGNFLWGKRGFHAKRFFDGFFEKIDPTDGYDNYITRKNLNGTRKTAIGKLIFSTDFEVFREQMKGEKVHNYALTEECVSRRNDSYVYPCCCVTDENGAPLESDFKMPTKHHLVLGNMGDPKYVEMPKENIPTMYIAKEGYCYLNIFFAMLINVSEEKAKDFTKMVRDMHVSKLQQWPSMLDVATACKQLAVFFPDTMNAELPRILVDHKTKTMHVLDSYGSLSTGYHILKANTISQLIMFASDELKSEMKHYAVGGKVEFEKNGEESNVRLLIRSLYKPTLMQDIIEQEPFLLVMGLVSPSVLLALFNSASLERATRHWLGRNHTLAQLCTMLSVLAAKVSVSKTLVEQFELLESSASSILHAIDSTFTEHTSVYEAIQLLTKMESVRESDSGLHEFRFSSLKSTSLHLIEKKYQEDLHTQWNDLGWLEKCCMAWRSRKLQKEYLTDFNLPNRSDTKGKSRVSLMTSFRAARKKGCDAIRNVKNRCVNKCHQLIGKVVCSTIGGIKWCLPDLVAWINVLLVFNLLLSLYSGVQEHIKKHRLLALEKQIMEEVSEWESIEHLHQSWVDSHDGINPTVEEFNAYLQRVNPHLSTIFMKDINEGERFQAKPKSEAGLEKIVAFAALLMMLVDSDRSDALYKILNKLKGIMSTVHEDTTKFQSIDDVKDILAEKQLTVDFEISADTPQASITGVTFEQWMANQLLESRTIPHYRTEGHFMEFTRATSAKIAHDIAHGTHTDILMRGAVGSGKSTSLPFNLSQKGRVLLLESTRPLAENVYKQLRSDPFVLNPTLKMRGHTQFGSTPIEIMTSGFALHFFANNPNQIGNFSFVIIDECHVNDANAMAFVCFLKEYSFEGKLIKVSATPPGRELELTPQKKVDVITEESMSLAKFASNLGSGVSSDATKYGDNILVYVASYNEVDQLSKLIIDKGYRVTKVDGRTMKSGAAAIEMKGSESQKHFVVATNIIENGVTLDVDVVVDFGMKVVPELDIDARMIRYMKTSINFGERVQRLGRVGRFKEGTAIRIGHTEKGLQKVPVTIATEAAFYCFTYGFPLMPDNVSTSLLANCTVPQARTMQMFELTPYLMAQLVKYDGTMHPELHRILKDYKLRDSEIVLNKTAIPSAATTNWLKVRELKFYGCKLALDESIKVPFYAKDIPDALLAKIWKVVEEYKGEAGFGRITGSRAGKIAYTLKTDPTSIQRTLFILDKLIEGELQKQSHFQNVINSSCSTSSFSLASITNAIRSRHIKDHTVENLSVLHNAKNQLLEFKNLSVDLDSVRNLEDYGALECIYFQSESDVSKHLQLKGHWNKSLVTTDAVLTLTALLAGAYMIYSHFKAEVSNCAFQAKSKRQRQKLKFREARDRKTAYEVHGDSEAIEHYFGSKYTEKGKKKGTTRGMGTKTRKFINMYNFDPTEYSFARYVDPLTGQTLDEAAITDLNLVDEHFNKVRQAYYDADFLSASQMSKPFEVQAYFVKDLTKPILKIDLTRHNPLRVGDKGTSIAGFPEKEGELRQSGRPQLVGAEDLPKAEEELPSEVEAMFESKSTFHGVRDYNPIATMVCQLSNDSNGVIRTLHGIGFGNVIITNQHLFQNNNGSLKVRTHHGEFSAPNTKAIQMFPIEGHDVLIMKMPKDFPPFPQKLKFRQTQEGEKVCLIGSNFQTKSISSTISEPSIVAQVKGTTFYKHWITTVDGQCGLPLVSINDGCILGIHSLTKNNSNVNMYTSFPSDFVDKYLSKLDSIEWKRNWNLNIENLNWGSIKIEQDLPKNPLFKVMKEIKGLGLGEWDFQCYDEKWLFNQLEGNVRAVATTKNSLVTKHIVKGKCTLFELFLQTNSEAEKFFRPLMGAYQKSALNKDAYVKDFMKYASITQIGVVKTDVFERAYETVIALMERKGFHECAYVTDEESIFSALNMKAAVGALYAGKKKEYFENYTAEDKEKILKASCYRLFQGKMGVWNGSLKAELRPVEKVLANKTRTFTAAPIDTLLGGKVCVDDFNNQFYDAHFKLPWSVGMTKFYRGWNSLLDLLPEGWIYCDADGSRFDSSLTPYLINAVLNIRLHFMEDWELGAQMLKNLYTEIIYTPIATADGTIVKKNKGNNSGQPSTVVDNTLMVVLAMYYSVACVTSEELDDIIKFCANGDDLIIAINPKFEWILDTLKDSFHTLGLSYDFSVRTKNKEELWFMSHQGIKRDGIYIPKLEMERIVSILEWDRAVQPEHRLEAICAAMIESWGYDELTNWIRVFYAWVLGQAPYSMLAHDGKAPYISELALQKLYLGKDAEADELQVYLKAINEHAQEYIDEDLDMRCSFQANVNAGEGGSGAKPPSDDSESANKNKNKNKEKEKEKDRDVNAGSLGTFTVPRLKSMTAKLNLPKVRGKQIVNLNHLLNYDPEQTDISNTRASHAQFTAWYEGVKAEYEVDDEQMQIIMNGLMVWCIENGTSPNINGMWVMMDGDQQVEYPIKPLVDHAKPTLRQIMAHFSTLAEAYIEKRNATKDYMPRYGLQRNLNDKSLARYAFDFYELTSKTPFRAREAHIQMKAAALRNANSKLFGLDGNVGTQSEDTERHTTNDVNRKMHTLMGVNM